MDDHVVPLLRKGECSLPFQIEMLLPADLDLALQDVFRLIERSRWIAPVIGARSVLEPTAGVQSIVNCQDRRKFFVLDRPQTRGTTRGQVGLGNDKEDRLADEVHHTVRQQRFR